MVQSRSRLSVGETQASVRVMSSIWHKNIYRIKSQVFFKSNSEVERCGHKSYLHSSSCLSSFWIQCAFLVSDYFWRRHLDCDLRFLLMWDRFAQLILWDFYMKYAFWYILSGFYTFHNKGRWTRLIRIILRNQKVEYFL